MRDKMSLALEFADRRQDADHQPALRGRGVDRRLAQRLEANASLGETVERVEEIAGAAGQAVEPGHHDGVVRADGLVEPG
jgi:hypothetical protein